MTHLRAAGSKTKWATVETMMAADRETSNRTQASSSADLHARGGSNSEDTAEAGSSPLCASESAAESPKNAVINDQEQTVKVTKRSGPCNTTLVPQSPVNRGAPLLR